MNATIYNQKGTKAGEIALPEKVFAATWRSDLVHQVVESMRSNKRAGTANAKTRSEVRGGGKKPWKQKGTGRARHGSSRSPIWVGGGVTHGPLAEKNYKRKISKKMRAQALFSVLSKKYGDGEVLFVDTLSMPESKTKPAEAVINSLSKISGFEKLAKARKPKALVTLYGRDEKTLKSYRNIRALKLSFLKNLNPLDVLNYKYLIIESPEESLKFLAARG